MQANHRSHGMAGDDHFRNRILKLWKMYTSSYKSVRGSQESSTFAEMERNEILAYLPNFKDQKVLEIGVGTGQFTAKLAGTASHVTTVDFIQECNGKNKEINKNNENISFMCADIKKLDFPSGSFEMVFTSGLFMFLSDEETKKLFAKVLQWLAPGGHFFVREPCYHRWNNIKDENDMPIYRRALEYCNGLETTTSSECATFKLIRGKNLLTYIQHHSNPTQVCFLAKRIDGEESDKHSQGVQSRYSAATIEICQRIYGYTWFSPGAEATSRDLCMELGFRPGQRVLDVGCGMGGSAIFLARHYGVQVHGIDLSSSMVNAAFEYHDKLDDQVKKMLQFEVGDVLQADFEENSFDFIYSRDVLVHIPRKTEILSKMFRWLKPGGTLFFTDFCKGPVPPSQELIQYRKFRSMLPVSKEYYMEEMKSVGFSDVTSLDMKEEFLDSQRKTLAFMNSTREFFVKDYSEKVFNDYAFSWQVKINSAEGGQLVWAGIKGRK